MTCALPKVSILPAGIYIATITLDHPTLTDSLLTFVRARDTYPHAVTEWFCSSGTTCCSVRDTGEDAELLWGCIRNVETCSRKAYLASENMGFDVIDDGCGEGKSDGDDDSGASGFAVSLPAVIGIFIVIGAVFEI